jgi:hypothetical protein
MTPRRKANHISHSSCSGLLPARRPQQEHHANTYVKIGTPIFHSPAIFRLCEARCSTSEQVAEKHYARVRAVRSRSSLALREWGCVPCVLCTKVPKLEREKLTGKFCGPAPSAAKLLMNNAQNLSGLSRASTVTESISATSRSWPSQKRRMPTSHSSRASMRERRGGGCPTTLSRQRQCSASSSLRS